MIREKFLWSICMDIYREMYRRSTPPADLDELIEKGITKKDRWFMNYYLDEEEQEKIIKKYLKKYRLSALEKRAIKNTIWLGASPTSVKKEKANV